MLRIRICNTAFIDPTPGWRYLTFLILSRKSHGQAYTSLVIEVFEKVKNVAPLFQKRYFPMKSEAKPIFCNKNYWRQAYFNYRVISYTWQCSFRYFVKSCLSSVPCSTVACTVRYQINTVMCIWSGRMKRYVNFLRRGQNEPSLIAGSVLEQNLIYLCRRPITLCKN